MQVSQEILAAMPKHTTCKALLEDVLPRLMPIGKVEPWTEWAVSVRWLDGPYYDREDQNRKRARRYKGRDLSYDDDPSEWLDRARNAYPEATYFIEHQSAMPSPVDATPSRIQQYKRSIQHYFTIDCCSHTHSSEIIPDVPYASPWSALEGTPTGLDRSAKQYAIVIHPYNSISSEYLSVHYGEVLELLEQQTNGQIVVRQFIEPKSSKTGLVYGKRCIFMAEKPGDTASVDPLNQKADGDWISPCLAGRALVDFQGKKLGETSLKSGDTVRIYDVKLNWAFVYVVERNTFGWVPHQYIKERGGESVA